MKIHEIAAKSILRKYKHPESWFVSRYSMNLYRGCTHNCIYCDGRLETYHVKGEFGYDIEVKSNAVELLKKELDPARKRKPVSPGFVMLGGGVNDTYQPVDKKYQLARQVLQLLYDFNYPVHILTKSTNISRDLDLLQKIHQQKKSIFSMSFSTVDDELARILEPGVPAPSQRLQLLASIKELGIHVGIYYMPVIPYITDDRKQIYQTLARAVDVGVDFVIFGVLTLKPGRQKEYFSTIADKHFPNKMNEIHKLYDGNAWGNASSSYYHKINEVFQEIATGFGMPKRVPAKIFQTVYEENEYIGIILEQLDYLVRLKGLKSPYRYAAQSVFGLKQPVSSILNELRSLSGVGSVTEKFIKEIVDTGTLQYYEKLL